MQTQHNGNVKWSHKFAYYVSGVNNGITQMDNSRVRIAVGTLFYSTTCTPVDIDLGHLDVYVEHSSTNRVHIFSFAHYSLQ